MKIIKQLAIKDTPEKPDEDIVRSLPDLIDPKGFAGWVYSIDFNHALVLTNDLWKHKTMGLPHNSFLLATAIDPSAFEKSDESDREVILLRVIGSGKLPHDDDLMRGKIDYYQQQKEIYKERGIDPITLNQMQFGALQCRVLGTFYFKESQLWLGSDIESYPSASRLKTYRPKGKALEAIVNYIDPLRKKKAIEDARDIGLTVIPPPFTIGTVRYTSSMRLQSMDSESRVPVSIQPSDFLARRTAVLGMTRTGKSNMIKQLISVVLKTSKQGNLPIGQVIFDMNGEYANANKQDLGSSISDVFPERTERYRLLEQEGFRSLRNNFYSQLIDGYSLIVELLALKKSTSGDVGQFLNLSFDDPDQEDFSEKTRFSVRKAAYWALLNRAGFKATSGTKTKFKCAQYVKAAVTENLPSDVQIPDPEAGLTPAECQTWFSSLRSAFRNAKQTLDNDNRPRKRRSSSEDADQDETSPSSSKEIRQLIDWVEKHADVLAMMNMLESKNEKDGFILGWRLLVDFAKYHTHESEGEVGEEIYKFLGEGKVVILDLSVGTPSLRERITKRIAEKIFSKSMDIFVSGKHPPNIVLYIEEAHNLIGKDSPSDAIWPRIAKEGAKYRIGLVYATQEVSAMHSNILANTENWFITHLNNKKEVSELAKFYDFGDFSESLIRAQDVGFARVKTLSGPYVVPVQIDKFDPEKLKRES